MLVCLQRVGDVDRDWCLDLLFDSNRFNVLQKVWVMAKKVTFSVSLNLSEIETLTDVLEVMRKHANAHRLGREHVISTCLAIARPMQKAVNATLDQKESQMVNPSLD